MIKHRRSGYSLLYILTAIPLVTIVGNMTADVLNRSIRTQTIATYQMTNYTETMRLVRQLQNDAAKAVSAELIDSDATNTLELKLPGETVVYAVDGQRVSRTVIVNNMPGTVITWGFKNASIGFSEEQIQDTRKLIWIEFEFRFTLQNGKEQTQQIAAAATVGTGG